MMQMLGAGGVEILTDDVRSPDASNPAGYMELEGVKHLGEGDEDPSWLREGRGKAVKIISYLLRHLPETLNYRVIFMRRDLREVLASQAKMLASRGEEAGPADDRMLAGFREHLTRVDSVLRARPCFDVLEISYSDVIADPLGSSRRVAEFVGGDRDVLAMASVVRPELYRNRS